MKRFAPKTIISQIPALYMCVLGTNRIWVERDQHFYLIEFCLPGTMANGQQTVIWFPPPDKWSATCGPLPPVVFNHH